MNVVFFPLDDSASCEFCLPMFRNSLSVKMEQSAPKRRQIKFRRRGITQRIEYNIQNTAKF
jgi:hypothetical protein